MCELVVLLIVGSAMKTSSELCEIGYRELRKPSSQGADGVRWSAGRAFFSIYRVVLECPPIPVENGVIPVARDVSANVDSV